MKGGGGLRRIVYVWARFSCAVLCVWLGGETVMMGTTVACAEDVGSVWLRLRPPTTLLACASRCSRDLGCGDDVWLYLAIVCSCSFASSSLSLSLSSLKYELVGLPTSIRQLGSLVSVPRISTSELRGLTSSFPPLVTVRSSVCGKTGATSPAHHGDVQSVSQFHVHSNVDARIHNLAPSPHPSRTLSPLSPSPSVSSCSVNSLAVSMSKVSKLSLSRSLEEARGRDLRCVKAQLVALERGLLDKDALECEELDAAAEGHLSTSPTVALLAVLADADGSDVLERKSRLSFSEALRITPRCLLPSAGIGSPGMLCSLSEVEATSQSDSSAVFSCRWCRTV